MAQIAHFSSEDEAPEEESFQVSQKEVQSKQQAIRKTLDATNSVQKQKRRQRDQLLKMRSQKKLLSEILQEEEPEEEPEEERQQIKVVRHTVKKLEAEKEGFRVKVLKGSGSGLPPPSSALVGRKERFLRRKR